MPFVVLFQVQPKPSEWDTYLSTAKSLHPLLGKVPGFIENIRYASLTRKGTILSLSTWKNEKALVRWRTMKGHHEAQEKGRGQIFANYHLRIGEIVGDSAVGGGNEKKQMRFDATEVGMGTAVMLIDSKMGEEWVKERKTKPGIVAEALGFNVGKAGAVEWDVFEAVLIPGDLIVMATWKDTQGLEAFEKAMESVEGVRKRSVRIVRDYGMFDRREAPQYYPDAAGKETVH